VSESILSREPAPRRVGAGRLSSCLVLIWCAAVAALVGTTRPAAAGYADGAPPGFSGGFKEQSCHACHFEAEPNTKPGEVSLTGVPDQFVAGRQYLVTVTLMRPGMKLAGFQLAARFDDGSQAGTLERAAGEEKRMAIEIQSNVHYANQRRPGADPTSPDTATWLLVWTAPAASRTVMFHVAANAADSDESVRGDYIYTATVQTTPR
jgi:hypothetical protein